MGKRFYKVTSGMIRLFSHRMKTEWEVPFEDGPCVFVASDAGMSGTVDMITKFPLREKMHPWIFSSLEKAKSVPAYMRDERGQDKQGRVKKATVPRFAAAVIPPLLQGIDYVPVYSGQEFIKTIRQSIRVLQKDQYLLLFPERPGSNHRWIDTGWLRLGELWYRAGGRALKMYPVHVDCKRHVFKVAAPIRYDPSKRFGDQEQELAEKLSKGLRGE